jgi:hypothetical protein
MAKKIDEFLYDKRTFQKNIAKGTLSEADYKDYVSSLPDESKNADTIKAFSEENVLTFASVENSK